LTHLHKAFAVKQLNANGCSRHLDLLAKPPPPAPASPMPLSDWNFAASRLSLNGSKRRYDATRRRGSTEPARAASDLHTIRGQRP
jgi:hypothetical protein